MSQQYGQPGGGPNQPPQYGQNQGGPQGQPPQGQPPQYGQPTGQTGNQQGPGQQPTQYVPGPPYGAPPPNYQQPNQPQPPYGQPPYGQPGPGGYQPAPPAPATMAPMAALKQPARQVEAAAYERSLTLLVYLFSVIAAAGILGLGDTPLALRSASGGLTYIVSFGLSLGYLVAFTLPLAIIYGVRKGELVRFHAKQTLWLLIGYTVVRLIVELFFLIPAPGVQDILFNGIVVGLLHVILVLAGAFAGVRAFFNREMYTLPVIGGFVK